jgi:hypothetical protein
MLFLLLSIFHFWDCSIFLLTIRNIKLLLSGSKRGLSFFYFFFFYLEETIFKILLVVDVYIVEFIYLVDNLFEGASSHVLLHSLQVVESIQIYCLEKTGSFIIAPTTYWVF